ncbi:serine hydrolase [Saccharibacillus sp. O23]|uniref:serine hydrolase domain-containing protein n=1 Tax=Saccharibacillus sp. O23 TaxID=2009338 RepID=UPI00211B2814|nr:serine hydrolase [Saccharibacillus sp. O23]
MGQKKEDELPLRILRSGLEVNSLVLLRGGRTALEWYREPYRKGVPQLLYSLSKSVTSIAVGIAYDQGLLTPDDPVIGFFPDKMPLLAERSEYLPEMKVRHLLSMTAGHEGDIYPAVVSQRDWAAAFLAQSIERTPGTHYRYSTPSTYMLSAIVERVSGLNLVDFLMPTLFGPLGIAKPVWETCPLGVTAGGMGLSLPTEDVAKFGQMLLEGGTYRGRRIVSESYIRAATSEQSDNRSGVPAERTDSAQGYGYQFHLCRFGAYRGDGSFGQLCLVSPGHDLVAAANCAFPSMAKLQTLLNWIFELACGEEIVAGKTTGADVRTAEAAGIYGTAENGTFELPFEPNVLYVVDDNPAGLRSLALKPTASGFDLTFDYGDGDERSGKLPFDFARALEAESVFVKDLMRHRQKVVTSVEPSSEDPAGRRLKLHYIETPYVVTYTIRPAEEALLVRFEINVSFGYKSYEAYARRS